MKQNEEAAALESDGLKIRTEKRTKQQNQFRRINFMRNFNTPSHKIQHNSRLPQRRTFKLPELPFLEMTAFVCDECAAPLRLYGENFIETYADGKVNVLRCLCDLHADEMEVNA